MPPGICVSGQHKHFAAAFVEFIGIARYFPACKIKTVKVVVRLSLGSGNFSGASEQERGFTNTAKTFMAISRSLYHFVDESLLTSLFVLLIMFLLHPKKIHELNFEKQR
jgi:hypothetical protein